MIRSIPPRTMRNIWNEKKRVYQPHLHRRNAGQNYPNQINSNKTSGTSGALYAEGKLKHKSIQGQPRNIYERAGHQGMIYPKNSKSSMPKIRNVLDLPSLDEAIKGVELEMFETGEKISVIIEQYFENVTDISYDTIEEGIIVHANKDYSIPLKLKKADTKTLEWSYNNGIIELTFKKSKKG